MEPVKLAILGFGQIARDHAETIKRGEQDVEMSRLQLVGNAFILGGRVQVEPVIK